MQVIKTFISIHTWDWLYSHGIFRSLSCIKYSLFMPPCKKGLKHSWNAVVDKSNKYNVVKSIERIFHVLPCWKPCIVLCERIKIRPSFFSHEKRPRAPTKNPHALQRRSFFNNNNIKLPGRKPPGQGNFGTFQPLFCVLVSIFSGVGWSLYVLATIVGQAPLHAITKGNLYHLFVWTWGPNLDRTRLEGGCWCIIDWCGASWTPVRAFLPSLHLQGCQTLCLNTGSSLYKIILWEMGNCIARVRMMNIAASLTSCFCTCLLPL